MNHDRGEVLWFIACSGRHLNALVGGKLRNAQLTIVTAFRMEEGYASASHDFLQVRNPSAFKAVGTSIERGTQTPQKCEKVLGW